LLTSMLPYVTASTRLPIIATSILSFLAAALLVDCNSVAVFFLTPFRAWDLLAGALLAYVGTAHPQRRWLREALAFAGLAAIAFACITYDKLTTFPGPAALAPVLGAVVIIHAGSAGPTS